MAKKGPAVSLIDTFSEFKELKNIDRTTMVSVLEESFRSVIAKMFGSDENYDVIVNPDKGDFEIWRNREVVADEDLTDPNRQIALSEARQIDASYEVGEEVTDEVIFEKFGRRAILNLRQTLASKIFPKRVSQTLLRRISTSPADLATQSNFWLSLNATTKDSK